MLFVKFLSNMSDEEYERFEVTDHDLAAELDPTRFRRNLTRNQQIYGIWADEEEERPRRGLGASSEGRGYGAGPVAFVSAGIQQPSSKKEEKVEETEEPEGDITDSSSGEEVEILVAKSGFKKNLNFDLNQIAGMRKKTSGVTKGFEIYGKGASMAMKMGFQPGRGLGKELQGISAPIETHKRKGRGAIGAYGPETKARIADSLTVDESANKSSPLTQVKESKWQKDGSFRKKSEKVEYQCMTMEEVLQQKHIVVRPDAGALAKTKVIDLTGPQQRILSGYHAISGQKKPQDEWEAEIPPEVTPKVLGKSAFELPELLYNINLLKDTCEQDILKNDKKTKYASDRKEVLKEEVKNMKNTLESEAILITNLEDLIDEVKVLTETPGLNLSVAYRSLGTMKRDHSEEWELYQLYNLVPAIIIPLLKEDLKLWNPLEVPQRPLHIYTDWSNLLGTRGDIFEWIMWETWMPSLRLAILTYWNVKFADSLLRVIETWKPLLAGWIYENILNQLILPKINDAVENWDPLSDEIPIHSWIHPWLPHLGSKLDMVYATIRKKLASALTNWHPCDGSAKKILAPWVPVFTKGSMDAFLLKNVVPKLHMAMQELVFNPVNQNLDPWNWVLDWLDMIPTKAFVHIFETIFFPNWLQFLMNWLSHMPNYEEVYQWYGWWRGVFPADLARDPIITSNLKKALELIGRAVQNPGQPFDMSGVIGAPPRMHPGSPIPQSSQIPQVAPEMLAEALRRNSSQVPHGFRDLIQMKCEEMGLVFMPIPNRYYEAKQVYRCGNVFMYISANVIFMQRDVSGSS
ncbi:unnamed protein product [Allacma fusca]|uniref:G-patch domain-containing protein n=1 Tax=Allacma fusca TaxID=39272 RepID=A0A8J2P3N8_9HEXA|nr:unnamed protein product [Allacma fusca]